MTQLKLDDYKKELLEVKDLLFYILAVWTIAVVIMSWVEFFFEQFTLPPSIIFSYLILVGAYIANKEANRWSGAEMKLRPGQFFVFLWWFNLLAMFIMAFFLKDLNLHVSPIVKSIAYDVTGGLIISEISKILKLRVNMRNLS